MATQTAYEESPFSYTIPSSVFYDRDVEPLVYVAVAVDAVNNTITPPVWIQFDPSNMYASASLDVFLGCVT